jgi:hypothetical protein
MTFEPSNNYENFKPEFLKDTGLEPDTHLSEYLMYYSGRTINEQNQILKHIIGVISAGDFALQLTNIFKLFKNFRF